MSEVLLGLVPDNPIVNVLAILLATALAGYAFARGELLFTLLLVPFPRVYLYKRYEKAKTYRVPNVDVDGQMERKSDDTWARACAWTGGSSEQRAVQRDREFIRATGCRARQRGA